MEFNRGDLDSDEQKLVDALETGTFFGTNSFFGHKDRDTWPVIRAETIRNLMRGVYQGVAPDPLGLRLSHVRIDGRIDLNHVDTQIPLSLHGCDLPEGLSAIYARLPALRIHGMTIDRPAPNWAVLDLFGLHIGVLDLVGTSLANAMGPALRADRLVVESDARFVERFAATGHGDLGAVRLPGATISGRLDLSGATLTNATGPALAADGITIESDAILNEGFTATGRGDFGTVRLHGATVGGQLSLTGAKLTNQTGPALVADRITVGLDACLNEGFSSTAHGRSGAVRLPGATIGGQLYLNSASFPRAVREYRTVVLWGARVGSVIVIDEATLKQEAASGRWDIRGLTYRDLFADSDLWLDFLREGTSQYSTQPYQQFAAVARANGDEKLTRKILIAQHDDLITRSRNEHDLLTGRQRAALRVLKYTVGYGYRTWLALAWLALFVGIAVVAAFTFGSGDWLWGWGWDWAVAALQQPDESKAGDPWEACRSVDLVVLGLETIPLIQLVSGGADRCFVTDTAAGTTFLGISVALKIAAWALAALFVAGYTSIVRNPGP